MSKGLIDDTNEAVINRLDELEKEYMQAWGKRVDYTIIPSCMTRESMVLVLERMVKTGESVLVSWGKIMR